MWEMGQKEAPDQKTNLESQQTVMLGGPSCWKEKTVNANENENLVLLPYRPVTKRIKLTLRKRSVGVL